MKEKYSFKKFCIDCLEVIITSTVLVFLIVNFLFITCQVIGSSMYPTLEENDVCLSFVLSKNIGIKRFDICVLKQSDSKKLVKRVIGLPNEKIEYRDNKLYINDDYCEEPFLGDDVYTEDLCITLGDDEYYCLGDNRAVSKDSRYYGPFKKEVIKSTNILVLYPFDNFGVK